MEIIVVMHVNIPDVVTKLAACVRCFHPSASFDAYDEAAVGAATGA
ncbi:hypothetical protein J5J83_15880 [Azoarcus sp. L1K30]|nr:hypothetical protein [Azoarcus sp. L1K30]MBR0567603.1 hypothetical protein [Azoarcus sp. L1K30]